MRFHVLGVGPIGSLVAFNLRSTLPHNHEVHIILRSHALTKQFREKGAKISIEHDGVVSTVSGFRAESMDQYEDKLYNMVFGEGGILRLPTHKPVPPLAPLQETGRSRGSTTGGDIESLIVTCKAYSTLGVLKRLQHRIKPESTIVLMQNGGLAVYEELVNGMFRNPDERPSFILVSNNHGAWLKAPYKVVHAGIGTLHFGIVPNGKRNFEKSYYDQGVSPHMRSLSLDDVVQPENDPSHSRYRSLRNTIAVLGGLTDLQPTWYPMSTLQLSMRRKLVVNSVVNPLTAIMGCRNGDLFANDAALRLADRICTEASYAFTAEAKAQAGEEARYSLPADLRTAQLMDEWQRVARITATNISSMLSDVRLGKQETEIDYLNGYLVKLAARYGAVAPVNATMVQLIKLRTSIPVDTPL